VADAWIAALAQARNATLVHKDPEFEQVEATIKVLKLPYKVGS
jgi:predicted nucleic acid-binding protein